MTPAEGTTLESPSPDKESGAEASNLAEKLWDIEQIKQLKARYFRLMDTKDWVAWRDLFTDDCLH
jgi:hypothetical protein